MTLTADQNKIFKALQPLEPKGSINFVTSLRIAHVSTSTIHIACYYSMVCVCVSVDSEAQTEQESEDEDRHLHRQSPHCHRQRGVCLYVHVRVVNAIQCTPQLMKLAKRLKKEKVTVDVVNFGETVSQTLFQTLSYVTRNCGCTG